MQAQFLRLCIDIAKVSAISLLEIITQSTHFLPAKKKILKSWIELQTNKNAKGLYSYI